MASNDYDRPMVDRPLDPDMPPRTVNSSGTWTVTATPAQGSTVTKTSNYVIPKQTISTWTLTTAPMRLGTNWTGTTIFTRTGACTM